MDRGRVRLSRVESHPDIFAFRIGLHFFHAGDFQQRLAQRAHALVAILAVGRDVDALEDRLIGGVVEVVRVGWIHALTSRLNQRAVA